MSKVRFAQDTDGKDMMILSDDFQVAADYLLLASRLEATKKEIERRHLVDTVSRMSKFNKYYCVSFADDDVKLAGFLHEQLLALYLTSKEPE